MQSGNRKQAKIITWRCYNARMLTEIQVGDKVRLRKAHPCGGYEWEVVRLGADIGLICLTCGHKVFLSRRELQRRMKEHFPKECDDKTQSAL